MLSILLDGIHAWCCLVPSYPSPWRICLAHSGVQCCTTLGRDTLLRLRRFSLGLICSCVFFLVIDSWLSLRLIDIAEGATNRFLWTNHRPLAGLEWSPVWSLLLRLECPCNGRLEAGCASCRFSFFALLFGFGASVWIDWWAEFWLIIGQLGEPNVCFWRKASAVLDFSFHGFCLYLVVDFFGFRFLFFCSGEMIKIDKNLWTI